MDPGGTPLDRGFLSELVLLTKVICEQLSKWSFHRLHTFCDNANLSILAISILLSHVSNTFFEVYEYSLGGLLLE